MNPKILITGSNGMLGHKIVEVLAESFRIITINRVHDKTIGINESIKLNIGNLDKLSTEISRINPSIIIHTAAIVDVDYCEHEPTECALINYLSVKSIVDSIEPGTKLIFISSESVFGENKVPASEDDTKNPLNSYTKFKSLAEDYIISNHVNCIIIRSNMYGYHKNWRGSLVEWAIDSLESNKTINGFSDVIFNPIYTSKLSEAISILIKLDYRGVIHLGTNQVISKYEFLKRLATSLGYNTSNIKHISIDESKLTKRVKNATLNIDKARSILGDELLDFENGFRDFLRDIRVFYENHQNKQ